MVMDAPSQFIFNLEKRNGQIKMIHSLASKSGEPAELKTYAVDFYGHLYKSEHKEYFFFCDFIVSSQKPSLTLTHPQTQYPLKDINLMQYRACKVVKLQPQMDCLLIFIFWSVGADVLAV